MAFTRFNYDDCRTIKKLQQQTDPGRWILDVPGNGSNPYYMEDPQIIIQKWGANLRTNTTDLESSLLGVNRHSTRDCLKDNYKNYTVPNEPIKYPTCSQLYVEQSRAIAPAWMVRDLEQVDWYYPQLNPQENICFPFENNLNTRIIEKDNFTVKRPCVIDQCNDQLPTASFMSNKSESRLCNTTNSCLK